MSKNVLFCYSRLPSFTNAVRDYVQAFGDYSVHRIHYYDMDSGPLDFDLEPFDCIIFNYCFWARCLSVSPDFRERVADFSGLKIAILQDEYEYFLWHEKTLIALGIDTIVTCVPEAHWRDVFRDDAFRRVTFFNALTGYVPDSLLSLSNSAKPLVERGWILGYRSRPVPFAYGRLTQEKLLIGQRMRQICAERSIPANIDVTEESRIYGAAWPEFVGNCRAVLGTESGSNVFDFDGSTKPAIEAFLKEHPDADFESVHECFLQGRDETIHMNQISPRIFEAIALRAGLVLFEGNYSGVVRPWEHFIPLKKDFSNVDEVFSALEDLPSLEAMIQRAYDDVIASGKYHFRTFIGMLDAHVENAKLPGKGYEPCYGLIAWRVSADAALKVISGQRIQTPTSKPLRHFDLIPDPVVSVRINWGALHRALMRRYETVLYSPMGRKCNAYLQGNALVYATVRKCVRLLTGRW
ncbi:hypothetical protein LZ012_04630 [Dechloromonas sp. XY25]|uniref:Glycosyltransferase family 1 protein n=1 Tax=Dechloromonas hankyongensis TaxID=2908002 RepID=A0ABS9JZD8_9RHOO|nr:hypothetical protein [Dechloromonas hankyongensis]MCG2576275.1 hypothetical protein [Dechloromonas hankyongensis]